MVLQSVIVEATSGVVLSVTIKKHMAEPTPLTSDPDVRILKPCNSSRLQDKGLFIARTLVNVVGTSSVPARIFNLSATGTGPATKYSGIAIAKPVHNVTEIELHTEP